MCLLSKNLNSLERFGRGAVGQEHLNLTLDVQKKTGLLPPVDQNSQSNNCILPLTDKKKIYVLQKMKLV